MLSLTAVVRASDIGELAKLTVLSRADFHSLSLLGSADRFRETANLMVNMGLRLRKT